jgi:hypothetical protein
MFPMLTKSNATNSREMNVVLLRKIVQWSLGCSDFSYGVVSELTFVVPFSINHRSMLHLVSHVLSSCGPSDVGWIKASFVPAGMSGGVFGGGR